MGPANNCLLIIVCLSAMSSNHVWLQIIFCSCVNKTPLFSSLRSLFRGGSRGRVQGVPTPLPPEMTCGFLIQLVFCKKKKTMGFIGVEVEPETSAPPPKKNPGSALGFCFKNVRSLRFPKVLIKKNKLGDRIMMIN